VVYERGIAQGGMVGIAQVVWWV